MVTNIQCGREITVHADNTHLRLNISLYRTAQHAIQCKMAVWRHTSSYSIEERLMARVWVHKRQHTGQTMSQVMAAFRGRFNKAPPRRAKLLGWEKGAFALGSVKDRLRSGRKTTRLETSAAVAAAIDRVPQ